MILAIVLFAATTTSPCDSPMKADLLACAEGKRVEAQARLDRSRAGIEKALSDWPEGGAGRRAGEGPCHERHSSLSQAFLPQSRRARGSQFKMTLFSRIVPPARRSETRAR